MLSKFGWLRRSCRRDHEYGFGLRGDVVQVLIWGEEMEEGGERVCEGRRR